MYMLQLQVNKGFGAKHLQSYNTSIIPNWVNPENIVNWIICCFDIQLYELFTYVGY